MSMNVISTLIGKEIKNPLNVIIQGWHGSQPFMTGCLIKTPEAHSVCEGVVIGIGQDDKNDSYSVTVEYNYLTWVRYCLLDSYDVAIGDTVTIGKTIGKAHKNSIRFEYCTAEVSDFPIRNLNRQLYKQDPTPILFGQEMISGVL